MIYLIYGILIVLSIVIAFATVLGVFKAGEKEGICNYNYKED
jgi:hypothetical protein